MPNAARKLALATAVLTVVAIPATAESQAGAAAPVAAVAAGPAVGDVAPDFALSGGTRYGLLKTPVRLSDLRGKTVVLAFFFQARTKG